MFAASAHQGRYRLRCVVESAWQPARVPAVLRGCVIEARWAGERTDPGDLYANTQMVAIALMRSCVAVVCSEDFQIAAAGVYEGP